MFGLGKKRTQLGKFIDQNRWSQEELRSKAKVNRDTISKACNDSEYIPSPKVQKKILDAIRKEIDPSVKSTDFWNI